MECAAEARALKALTIRRFLLVDEFLQHEPAPRALGYDCCCLLAEVGPVSIGR